MAALAANIKPVVKEETTTTTFETPVVKSESTFFKEREEVLKLISELCKSSIEAPVDNTTVTEDEKTRGPTDALKKDTLSKIFDKYQEESAILDPSLNDMVYPLMAYVLHIYQIYSLYTIY